MGSLNLDLRTTNFCDGETVLNLTAVMGGIEILVPAHLSVYLTGTAVLGGLHFFDRSNGGIIADLQVEHGDQNSPKRLRIDCIAVMGGITVKSI